MEAVDPPRGLLAALGAEEVARWVGRSRFDYLVELASEAAVRGLAPDFRRLRPRPVLGRTPRPGAADGFQASRRGGVVRARPAGDRVLLGGQAVTVLRGELVTAD